jgi:SAM-dependent methyltransferase
MSNEYEVMAKIHPNDDMLFKMDGKPIAESYTHYHNVGLGAVANIEEALYLAGRTFEDIKSCLDFPSGYGRVLRLLCTKINPNKIIACDINQEAVEFCSLEFGVIPFLSDYDLNKVNFKKYDLIWVGSLFTHFDQDNFLLLMQVLSRILEKSGVLVFTTHGYYSLELDSKKTYGIQFATNAKEIVCNNGFYYIPYPNSHTYGISVSTPDYVLSLATKFNLKPLMYRYRGWDKHQDVFAFQH